MSWLLLALVANQSIVGGTLAQADPEVFMLQWEVFGIPNMCSATLIGERTLLTAAHCVDGDFRFRAVNAAHGRNAPSIEVIDIRKHPQWSWLNGSAYDIALARLKTAPPVTPKPLASAPPPKDGALRVLGYGYTVEDDYTSWGEKHEATLTARSIEPGFITLGDGMRGFCNGDSGGPSFHRFPDGVERVVGVHIEGSTCTDGRDVRVDVHRQFIDEYLGKPDAKEPGIGTKPLPPEPAETEPEPEPEPEREPGPGPGPEMEQERTYLKPGCGCTSTPAPLLLLALLGLRRRLGRGRRAHSLA